MPDARLAYRILFLAIAGTTLALTVGSRYITQTAKLVPDDGQILGNFGESVAIDGDTIVVGRAQNYPAAYIFERDGTSWVQEARFDAPLGTRFGESVAVDGDTVVVGAPRNGAGVHPQGFASVFVRDAGGWALQADLIATDVTDDFGHAVAIEGDLVAVGAIGDDSVLINAGAVYVFRRSGTTWTQDAKLMASDASFSDELGQALDVSNGRIAVGAQDDTSSHQGAAYIFAHDGTSWVEEQKLQPTDLEAWDRFGTSVALVGDRFVSGSPNDDDGGADSGSVYVFDRGPSGWQQSAKLLYSNSAPNAYLGIAITAHDETIVAGAWGMTPSGWQSGAAILFTPCGSSWTDELFSADDGSFGHQFGESVAVQGSTLVAGARNEDTGGQGVGAAYVFEYSEPFTSYCPALPNSSGTPATMTLEGCHDVTANDVELAAVGCPPAQFGVFFFGSDMIEVPFGDGIACVGGSIYRLSPPQLTDAAGAASRDLDLSGAPALGLIGPGTEWSFQFWFRDPQGGPAGFNLSDAVRAVWK